jgi:hypothetical protein
MHTRTPAPVDPLHAQARASPKGHGARSGSRITFWRSTDQAGSSLACVPLATRASYSRLGRKISTGVSVYRSLCVATSGITQPKELAMSDRDEQAPEQENLEGAEEQTDETPEVEGQMQRFGAEKHMGPDKHMGPAKHMGPEKHMGPDKHM